MASQSTALRALIAAIPHVGGSIDALVTGPLATMSKAADYRLNFMFAELHREMRVLDASAIRTDFLETEEWADVVRHAVALAVRTRDIRRLSAFARILAVTATGTVRPPGHARDLIDVQPGVGDEDVLLAMLG